ncbi:cytochrome b5 [Suillus bovinus]|uniref:cytochrome b5 n=1 Tax=Suillus bovinus TaxID=48563 RepID=UPI001B88327E|nr:cytochrome b5 [Suillus bovinus]KAG2154349.1 cytochrome b5 [Suillus bovinus]
MFLVVIYGLVLALPLLYLVQQRTLSSSHQSPPVDSKPEEKKSLKTIMQPPRDDLDPPKDDPFTLDQLKEFDWLRQFEADLCTVFDVTRKSDVYGPGKSYNIFAGRDGSKGLGMSSLNPEDAVPDYSDLPENEKNVLNDWFLFFQKRYNIVGRVTDMPTSVSNLANL